MRIAITGGTGFVGKHFAEPLIREGHQVVLLARHRPSTSFPANVKFVASNLMDTTALAEAFSGCDAVAHCAGINREIGEQIYRRVHIEATKNVVEAARQAQVLKITLMSFLRARPDCGSPYHESKWEAEEIIRNSGLDYTIFKAGMVYGRGDHMLDHLSHSFHTLPLLATVGFRQKAIRPLAIDDLIDVMYASLIDNRMTKQTIAITGAEELYLSDAAERVAKVLKRRIAIFPAPIWFHYVLALLCEWAMKVPLVAKAQVRILSEGVTDPPHVCDPIPEDLRPTRKFTDDQIRKGLPEPGPFGLADLRCCLSHAG
ncbi:MAG TPA: NAD(P)H-binding protein [Terriglobales bacterium]|nr:NAD(P)H-binding protein [Terriglobales bacterium]